jgi:hypothetical protein
MTVKPARIREVKRATASVPLQCRSGSAHAPVGVADLRLGSDAPHVFIAGAPGIQASEISFPWTN